jgi:hypothetical protein
MDPLSALLAIISDGVEGIRSAYSSQGSDIPSLDEPYIPDPIERKVGSAVDLVVAAAFQLIATLRHPTGSIIEASGGVCCTIFLLLSFTALTKPPDVSHSSHRRSRGNECPRDLA